MSAETVQGPPAFQLSVGARAPVHRQAATRQLAATIVAPVERDRLTDLFSGR